MRKKQPEHEENRDASSWIKNKCRLAGKEGIKHLQWEWPRRVLEFEQEGKNAIGKVVKVMALLRFTLDVSSGYFLKERELGVGKKRAEKVVLLLTISPHNVQSNRNDLHALYDVFGSYKIKDMAKRLKGVINPGVHVYVSCFAIRVALLY